VADVAGTRFRLGQRPALDGLRAVAILAVIGYHDGWLVGGFLGVDLFFALSGFLITSLLLEEWEERGRIAIGRFYARRFLLLAPALGVFVGVLFLTTHVLLPDLRDELRPRWALAALLYWANVLIGYAREYPLGVVSICWSLAQEEQFYLLWPLGLRTLVTRGVSRPAAALGAAGLCLGIAALRHLLVASGHGETNLWLRIYFAPDTRADAILVGCALALYLSWRPLSRRAVAAGSAAAFLGLAILARLAATRAIVDMVGSPVLIALAAWCSAAVVFGALHARPLVRVLELGPLVWIGKLSYSLYLWHAVGLEVGKAFGPWLRYPTVLALAVASHLLVERPFLQLKARLAPGAEAPGAALGGWLRRTGPALAAGMVVLMAVTAMGYERRLRAWNASGPEAIAKAKERAASHPGDPEALRELARLLDRSGDARGSVAAYRELLTTKGASGDDLIEMGFAFLKLGQARNAEVCFRKVLSREPGRLRARLGLGEALLAAGRHAEATASFAELLAADPGSAVAHERIGVAYLELGRFDQAIEHFSEAARLDPRPERLARVEWARREAASRRSP
jgi:peptidoglycan/LPS O-acetylase OafA/YrhL/Flp pilus assembly protein TadD